MALLRRSFLVVFAAISACGTPPDGDAGDARTRGVGSETHANANADAGDRDADSVDDDSPSLPGGTLVAFAGDIAVFDGDEEVRVVDRRTGASFAVPGHALLEPAGAAESNAASIQGPWSRAGLEDGLLTPRAVLSSDGRRLVVRRAHALVAVDLADRGRDLAALDDADGLDKASFGPDGGAFAAWSASSLRYVRIADGASVAVPLTTGPDRELALRWTNAMLWFSDATCAHAIDREALSTRHAKPNGHVRLTSSRDESLVVVSGSGIDAAGHDVGPASVELWRRDASEPLARFTSAAVSSIVVADDGAKVAWSEYAGDAAGRTHLHVVDVRSGVHVRFLARSTCPIDEEAVASLTKGELRTDAACSPGCPSIPSTSETNVYDSTTGAFLRHEKGATQRSWNEEEAERRVHAADLARRFGFEAPEGDEHAPVVVTHDGRLAIAERHGGLVIADPETGRSGPALEGSEPFAASQVTFWTEKTGAPAFVVAASSRGMALWSVSTGKRIWTSRP